MKLSRTAKIGLIVGGVSALIITAIVLVVIFFVLPLFGTIKMEIVSATLKPTISGDINVQFVLRNLSSSAGPGEFQTKMSYGGRPVSSLSPIQIDMPSKDQVFKLDVQFPVEGTVASSMADVCKGKSADTKIPLHFKSKLIVGSYTTSLDLNQELPCSKVTIDNSSNKQK